jgi:hypothetical protein
MLLANDSLERPRDFQQRLEDILFNIAVIPSAHRGMLGDLKHGTDRLHPFRSRPALLSPHSQR